MGNDDAGSREELKVMKCDAQDVMPKM